MEVPHVTDTAPVPTLNPWLHPLAGGEPPPLSDRLIRALEAHAAASAADLATCRELVTRMDDPVVGLLVGMIVQDEQRHDALLRSMVPAWRRKLISFRHAARCQCRMDRWPAIR